MWQVLYRDMQPPRKIAQREKVREGLWEAVVLRLSLVDDQALVSPGRGRRISERDREKV